MHLVNLTTAGIKRIVALIFSLFIYALSFAQENSPYSRYGMGDIVPAGNMVNRSMGGISAGYADYTSINFLNPAALGMLRRATLDIGGEIDRRTLKSNIAPEKYTSTNTVISYLQFGVPVATAKMKAKGITWGVSMGIRPITRTNYKIESNTRLVGIDSLNTIYEGSGGISQASLTTGFKIRNFSFGITGGYNFGTRNYSTRVSPINDTVLYYKSNIETKTNFSGGSLTAGAMYDIKASKAIIRIGAYANLEHKLSAKQSIINETFAYDGNGGTLTIDTVEYHPEVKGKIVYPATYALGFTRIGTNWLYGADFEMTSWNNYRYYGAKDLVDNTWKLRGGVQYFPLKNLATKNYFKLVQYRAGAYFGPDMVKLDNSNRSEFGLSFGAGLPLSVQRYSNDDYAVLNAGLEFASRGNKQSKSLRENVMRFTIGFAMNASWFQKRKYD